MPDVEKTVNIKINVDDAELSKIDTAEGKVRDMVDKLKEVKGGTFDIKPGGGGATPSGKTPDRDPSFQMLRTINITLNKILGAMGSYGGGRIRRQGSSDPYERVSGKIINEISNANKYAAKGTYKDNSGEKPGKLYGKAWVEDFMKRTYEPMSRPVALPESVTNFSKEMETAYENTVHFSKAMTKITSEITAQAIARAHQETLMKGGKIERRDWVEEERNRGLSAKRTQYENYLDMLQKEGVKRKQKDTIDWFDGVKEAAKPTFSVEDITSRSYVDSPWNPQVNNKKRSIEIDAANDWRKGIRGMITGALIDFHLLRVIGQSSHVVAASMDMLGKTMGLLLDVILLPFLPAMGILARGIATFATLLMSTNPIITAFKTALSVLIAAITTIVLIGAFKGGMTGGMFGAVRGGFGALRHGAGKILGRASGGPLAFGQTAIVGENGPEMLLPTSGGFHVVPNNQLRMLADGTDLTSVISGGIVGGGLGYLTGKMFGGDLGGYLGAGIGAGLGAGGVMGGLPQAIGQAASFVYGQPVVQGVLATMASLAGSINAVIAPLAPILGGAGGIALGAVLGRGYGGGSETTAKVGNVTNKNISAMSYGVQNAVGKAGQSTNTILTMILLRLNGCFNICPESIARITTGLSGAGAPTNLIRIGVGTGAAVATGVGIAAATGIGKPESEVEKAANPVAAAMKHISDSAKDATSSANSLSDTLSGWKDKIPMLPTPTPSGETVYITKPDLTDKGGWTQDYWNKDFSQSFERGAEPNYLAALFAGGSAASMALTAAMMPGATGVGGLLSGAKNVMTKPDLFAKPIIDATKKMPKVIMDTVENGITLSSIGEDFARPMNALPGTIDKGALREMEYYGMEMFGEKIEEKYVNALLKATGPGYKGGSMMFSLKDIMGGESASFTDFIGSAIGNALTGKFTEAVTDLTRIPGTLGIPKGAFGTQSDLTLASLLGTPQMEISPKLYNPETKKVEKIENNYNITIHSTAQNGDQLYNEFIRRMKQDGARIS